MRLAAASRFRPMASKRGAIRSSQLAAAIQIGCAVSSIPMSAKVRAFSKTVLFNAINSSSDATYCLAFAIAMSWLRWVVSGDPDAMSLEKKTVPAYRYCPLP